VALAAGQMLMVINHWLLQDQKVRQQQRQR
jgi:hypothetical protein